jgi:phosphoribosylformylglycinamidine (FGAM) synthase-like enzyme
MGHGDKRNLTRSVATSNQTLFEFGPSFKTLKASEFAECFDYSSLDIDKENSDYNEWDFSICKKHHIGLYHLISSGLVQSCHDISDGGLICTISEMLMDNRLGLSIDEVELSLFDQVAEGPGRYVVGVDGDKVSQFMNAISKQGLVATKLGECTKSGTLKVSGRDGFEASIDSLTSCWRRAWGVHATQMEIK